MHYIHLGHVGLIANFRWCAILDFVMGWTTYDLMGDDVGSEAAPKPAPAEEMVPLAVRDW